MISNSLVDSVVAVVLVTDGGGTGLGPSYTREGGHAHSTKVGGKQRDITSNRDHLPGFSLDRFIAQRFPNCEIAIHGDPHERVHRDRPEGDHEVADQPAHHVPVHPVAIESRIDRERHDEQTA